MAGHSKWANIQHRKNAQDARRGKIFTKLIREIAIAARSGGGDPAANPRLRLAIDKALGANMAKDSIERAVKKATGELAGVHYEDVRYEGYAPGGVAVIVECTTDNRQRTVSEVRHAFTKFGGQLGTDGSVAYLFKRLGVLTFAPGADEARLLEVALEAGADDLRAFDDGAVEVITAPEQFEPVRAALEQAGCKPDAGELVLRADTEVALQGEAAQTVARLLEWLDDLDDVQAVHSNADLPPEAYD